MIGGTPTVWVNAHALADMKAGKGAVAGIAYRRPGFDVPLYEAPQDHTPPEEVQQLRDELNSWRTRGRGLMLHDPEMAESMAKMKARIQADPDYARSLLRSAGIITDTGELAPEYGDPGSDGA